MTTKDFGPLNSSFNSPTPMPYDIDLEARTCSCQRGKLWVSLFTCPNGVKREKCTKRRLLR